MFEKIRTGWALAKQSIEVIRLDKELLLFPLLSGICCLMVSISFALPVFFSEGLREILWTEENIQNPILWIGLFIFYFTNYFFIMFFNAALIGCSLIRFAGGNPTLGNGMKIATARLPQIFSWALVSASVGVILKLIESRSEKVGQIIAALLGMAWTATAYFVLPVLVVEKTGPLAAYKRSLQILKKAWGESLSANIGIGLILFGFSLVAILPGFLGVLAGSKIAAGIGILISVLLFLLISLISGASKAIIMAALYYYAGRNKVPAHFDEDLLQQAFSSKS